MQWGDTLTSQGTVNSVPYLPRLLRKAGVALSNACNKPTGGTSLCSGETLVGNFNLRKE